MEGYLVYRNYKDNCLYYFNIKENRNVKMPFDNRNAINNHYKDYDFFLLNGSRVIASYEINDTGKISIYIYTFPDFKLSKIINTDFSFDKDQYYKFKYIPETNELFVRILGFGDMLIELNNNNRKLVQFDTFNYYNNKYIGRNRDSLNEQIDSDISYSFLKSTNYRFSNILEKVIYREINSDGIYYIKIYDLKTDKITETGLIANEIPRYAMDGYQYSFFGDNLILYGECNKNILKQIKYMAKLFLSGGMQNDPPMIYRIFDYENKTTIGYFKNIDVFDILIYY